MTVVAVTALGVGGATVLGAILGFLIKNIPHRYNDALLGFASGIMLAASFSGLITPSLKGETYGLPCWAFFSVLDACICWTVSLRTCISCPAWNRSPTRTATLRKLCSCDGHRYPQSPRRHCRRRRIWFRRPWSRPDRCHRHCAAKHTGGDGRYFPAAAGRCFAPADVPAGPGHGHG